MARIEAYTTVKDFEVKADKNGNEYITVNLCESKKVGEDFANVWYNNAVAFYGKDGYLVNKLKELNLKDWENVFAILNSQPDLYNGEVQQKYFIIDLIKIAPKEEAEFKF